MSTQSAFGVTAASDNKLNDKTLNQMSCGDHIDKENTDNNENISSNLAVGDSDLISKPSYSPACALALEDEGDDISHMEDSSEVNDVACRLPSSGTVDDLEELTAQASPTMPPIMAPLQCSEPMASHDDDCSKTAGQEGGFRKHETAIIFDWDDTLLPSTWVQRQGLTLCDSTTVSAWQKEQLDEVAVAAAETLRLAMQFGEVVFVTNAEHGWVPLSCLKFMPTLYPLIEGIRVLSARTTYETPSCKSPLEWKLRAFESEVDRLYGLDALHDANIRKNVVGLGDSVHEREALLRACAPLPNCCSKSLKFVERPDIGQMLKQHSLVASCFNQVIDHDGNLDLLIRCD